MHLRGSRLFRAPLPGFDLLDGCFTAATVPLARRFLPGSARVLQGRWQVNVAAVAPVGKVSKQIRDHQKRVLLVTKRLLRQSSALGKDDQGGFRPGCTFVVSNALIRGCLIHRHKGLEQQAFRV
jgi:hypothetical protein